jgi:hypothetical protein
MNPERPAARSFREQLAEPLAEMLDAYQISEDKADPGTSSPPMLVETFEQLFEAMQRTEAHVAQDSSTQQGRLASSEDVTELGEYALELFDQSLRWAKNLNLSDVFNRLQTFTIAMARWIALHGGQLLNLEPVVDAFAHTANRTQEPGELLALYQAMGEIVDAAAAVIREDVEKTNPGRPWRILHLNRAIVATRTHHPDIMDQAFSLLTEHFPEDAAGFFAQGMEQMELLNYPPHVREVMDRYYRKWSINRSLH